MGLRALRERSGLTLQQLDSLTGVDFTRLWVYENHADEARNMYLGTAAKLAQALHCNVLDLYPDEHVWRGGVSAGVVGLKNIRKARRLTQVELAGLSGIARPSISVLRRMVVLFRKCICGRRYDCLRRCNATLWIFLRKDTEMGMRELRLKRGMTQQQLADKVGMAQSRIAAYENGVNSIENMTLDKAIRICDALKVRNPRKLLDSDPDSESSADSK